MATVEKLTDLITRSLEFGKIDKPCTATECITVGLHLEMVKAASEPGTFWDRVNALGLNKSEAASYMACARRFGMQEVPLIFAAGSANKLVMLLELNAEEVAGLIRGGQVRGLSMDTLATMTARQLRKALGQSPSRNGVKLSVDEERMLRNYRKSRPEAKAHIARTAELLASNFGGTQTPA